MLTLFSLKFSCHLLRGVLTRDSKVVHGTRSLESWFHTALSWFILFSLLLLSNPSNEVKTLLRCRVLYEKVEIIRFYFISNQYVLLLSLGDGVMHLLFPPENICTSCVTTCHAPSIWNQMSSNIYMFWRTVIMLTISFLPDVLDMGLTLPSAIMEAGPHSFLAARYFTMIFIVCNLWFITTVWQNEDILGLMHLHWRKL